MSELSPAGREVPADGAGAAASSGWDPAGERLEHGDAARRSGSRRGRRGLAAAGAAMAVTAVGVAAAAAAAFLSGGGTQPEELIPAGAVFYADLDLDPPAGQKANIARFLRRFDDLDSRLGAEEGWRPALLEQLLDSPEEAAAVDDWLGDRVGVAVLRLDAALLASGGLPVVLAVQATDTDAASAHIREHLAGPEDTVLVVDDYVLVAPPAVDLAQAAADAAEASLADSQPFRDAMDPLGDGVAQLYLDTEALGDFASLLAAAGGGGAPGTRQVSGQAGFVVRVEPDAVELIGRSPGDFMWQGPTTLAARLPVSTAAMLAWSGMGDVATEQWQHVVDSAAGSLGGGSVRSAVRALERSSGLRLPEDLATLLGDDLVVALDGVEVRREPRFGVRAVADPAQSARLVHLLRPQLAEATGGYGLELVATADGWVLASGPVYSRELAADAAGFLDQAKVAQSLPDAAGAVAVGYVDLDAALQLADWAAPGTRQALEPLAAVGGTVHQEGDEAIVRVRLTLD